ncbi:MAG: YfhO family protein [Mucilaginibacter sp.]
MNNWFKRNGIHFAIIGIFLAICFLYFTPAFQGKTLGQVDVTGAQSTQTEINSYKAKDTTILWTNQIFGGMPTFQIWAPYPNNITTPIIRVIKAVFPNPIDTVLILLIGTYFLFLVLKLNPWLAAAGAIAFTFSSYNIIYLAAGHSNQAFAIAFFAPILASIILTLRGKYVLGASLTALFLAIEIRANHIQMTYYLMFAIIILVCIELYHAIKAKTTPAFLKSLGYLATGIVLAIVVNASILWSTYEYGKDTIRGKSNLTSIKEPSNGLDKDYAYQYSQGVGECLTFLIPNAYGGGSGTEVLDQNSETAKVFLAKGLPEADAVKYADQIGGGAVQGLGTYWGNKQPSTSGPWYFGAVICFLFVFGLLVVKNRAKWWLLGTVVLTVLLSFGNNWPFLSDIFFNYFPLYNKFRAVESILAVTSLCFPILAFLAIKETIEERDNARLFKKLKLTLYIVGGLTLLIIVLPDMLLSFRATNQADGVTMLTQAFQGDNAMANSVANAIVKDRIGLARADAIRTLIFILITFGILWAFIKHKINVSLLSAAFLILILVDMWQIDKRYLKEDSFEDKKDSLAPAPREVDQFIQRDTDPDFRVFDATQGLLNDTFNPFFHKTFGGYSAARLKRIQELVDGQFSKSINHDVLDMMNVKYIISADQKTQSSNMSVNQTACGHAWFVKDIKFAKNADEEMQAISSFDPKNSAIVDKRYSSLIDKNQLAVDTNASIKLVSYNPDHMIYESGSTANQIAVFSEIYYDKGWKMLIDGKEQPYFRADYVLRAAEIPVGNHKVEFIFHPASYYTGEGISLAGSILLVLSLGFAGYTESRKKPTGKKA